MSAKLAPIYTFIICLVLGIWAPITGCAQDLDALKATFDSLQTRQQAAAAEGDYKTAAYTLAAYNSARFRWQNLFDSLKVLEMKGQYDLDLQARQIEVEEARIGNQRRVIFVSLGIGMILVIAFLLIRNTIRTNTRKEAERFRERQLRQEAESRLQEEQIRRTEQEKRRLQHQVDLKNRHLSSQMLQLLAKKQALLNIQEKAETMKENPALMEEILAEIKGHINPNEDMAAFLVQFASVYPDFIPKLKKTSPQLTENDLKLCVLLRLQLSSKELAALLGLTPDSIKTSRYRLSKKLGLPKGEKLQEYLIKVE